jgi:hypothetical protein
MNGIVCGNSAGYLFNVYWLIFYPDCRQRVVACNAGNGAYLPAITCCIQGISSVSGCC